jgi:hypothetical protein
MCRSREEPAEEDPPSKPGNKRQKVGGKIDIADRVSYNLARVDFLC